MKTATSSSATARARRAAGAVGALLVLAVPGGCRRASADAGGDDAAQVRVQGADVTLPQHSPQIAALSAVPVAAAATELLRLNGRLVWNEDVTVRVFSPFAGRVVRVLVDAGQVVKPGDVLALIAAPDFGQAQADAQRAATDLALADRAAVRARDLARHGVIAQRDLDAAEGDLARARAEQQRAQARLALYGGDTASVNQVFPLRAPLGGTVVERSINPGEEVRPDQMLASAPQLFAPLFVISDPAHLWVQLDLPERDLAAVSAGAAISVRTQAWPDRAFPGRVTLVASEVDPDTRTVRVRGTLDNPARLLRAEMLVTVELPVAAHAGVSVPEGAVLLAGDRHVVFVEEGPGRYRRAEVTLGDAADGRVTVLGGLRAGERVVSGGSLLLEQLFQQQARS